MTGGFFASALAMDAAAAIFLVALPFLAMNFGATSLTLGILGACRATLYIATTPICDHFSDRGNRRTFIVVGALAAVVMSMLMGITHNLTQLFLVAILWTAAPSLFWPSLFGWTGDAHEPQELGHATGAVNLGWAVGTMLGALAGGFLFTIGPSIPFFCAAIPAFVAFAVFIPFPFRRILHSHAPHLEVRRTRRREIIALWMGNFGVFAMVGLLGDVFPRLGREIGVTAAIFGTFMFGTSLVRSLAFLSGFWWSRILRDWRVAIATQLLAAAGVATVCTASAHGWLAMIYGLLGLASGVSYYRGSYASLAIVGARGFRSALVEASAMAGMTAGSLGGGIIAQWIGLRAPYVPCALLAAVLAAVQAILIVTARRKDDSAREVVASEPR